MVDATCPCVANIHKIVREHSLLGHTVVIVGEATHPEVVGIAAEGEVVRVIAMGDEGAVRALPPEKPVIVCQQTTSDREKWISFSKIFKKYCTNLEIFDTICFATEKRQKEAAEIAERTDAMIVIGDRISANTGKLVDVCARAGKPVFRIESADEVESHLPKNLFAGSNKIGITAGASVPAVVIKEVSPKAGSTGSLPWYHSPSSDMAIFYHTFHTLSSILYNFICEFCFVG